MIRNLLLRLAFWILDHYGYHDCQLPVSVEMLIPDAKRLSLSVDEWDASGEAKRHRVYAQMIKDHPEALKNHIGLAIELGIMEGFDD